MISFVLVIFTIAATQSDHVFGKIIGLVTLILSIYMGFAYRRLGR